MDKSRIRHTEMGTSFIQTMAVPGLLIRFACRRSIAAPTVPIPTTRPTFTESGTFIMTPLGTPRMTYGGVFAGSDARSPSGLRLGLGLGLGLAATLHEFFLGVHLHFAENGFEVIAHGELADEQTRGNA